MLRAGVGQSANSSTERAAEEAAAEAMNRADIQRADAAVVFCTVDHLPNYPKLFAALRRVTGTDRIVGSSGVGILTGKGEIEGSSGVGVLVLSSDRVRSRPFLVHPLRERDEEAAMEIARETEPRENQAALLLLFPDTYNGSPQRLLRTIEAQRGFLPVIGAGSSENGSSGATYQICADRVTTNAVAGLHLSGPLESTIEITQGCQPASEPMRITKAEKNLIFEINDRPAFEVFARTIKGPLLSDLRRALAYVFVGLPASPEEDTVAPGHYLVRNIVGLDPARGILAVGEEVRVGEPMIFTLRDAQRAREDLTQMLTRQLRRLEGGTPDLGFYFNCCARGTSLYGIPGIDTAYIRQALGDFPLIGFFGGYELAPLGRTNHLFAYTGVLALIREAG